MTDNLCWLLLKLSVHGVLVITFIVQCYSKVFKAVNGLVIDNDGVLWFGGTGNYFFIFTDIEVEMVVLTPFGEVCDGIVVIQDVSLLSPLGNGLCDSVHHNMPSRQHHSNIFTTNYPT